MNLEASTRLMAETYKDYIKRLEQQLQSIGSGGFSTVYQHPALPNVAVKVFADSAYLKFLQFCDNNDGSKWVPKVFALEPLKLDFKTDAYAVFLEKLKPANKKAIQKFFDAYSQFQTQHANTRMYRVGWDYIAKYDDDAQLRHLAAFISTNYAHLDLRDPNFMLRGSQLVFSDPIAY